MKRPYLRLATIQIRATSGLLLPEAKAYALNVSLQALLGIAAFPETEQVPSVTIIETCNINRRYRPAGLDRTLFCRLLGRFLLRSFLNWHGFVLPNIRVSAARGELESAQR